MSTLYALKDFMSFESALREAMFHNGLPFYGHLYLEAGKYYSFNSDGICHKKCCRYRVFEMEVGAHIRCWKRDINVYWFFKDENKLSIEDKKKFNKERADLLDLREKEKNEGTLLARQEWWESTELDIDHPYVIKKRIRPCYARQYKNAILLPIYNSVGEIVSNQKIFPDSAKRFAKSAPYAGGMLFLSEHPTSIILIAEGWATACSIREVTTAAICVAFNDSNMVPVAKSIKKLFPKSHIVICSDKGESGEKYAKKSAQAVNGKIIVPVFKETDSGTDFNDIACLYGFDELENQLSSLKEGGLITL